MDGNRRPKPVIVGSTPIEGTISESSVHSRDRSFDFSNVDPLFWNRSEFACRLLNSLSLMFPVGEKHFIQAVRSWIHMAPSDLLKDIEVFFRQEARHSREHAKFNRLLLMNGVGVSQVEAETIKKLAQFYLQDDQLISTVVLEEITGLGAKLLPYLERWLLSGDEAVAEMWRWHALEEKEHVHVARSLLKYCGISKRRFIKVGFKTVVMFVKQLKYNWNEVKLAEDAQLH